METFGGLHTPVMGRKVGAVRHVSREDSRELSLTCDRERAGGSRTPVMGESWGLSLTCYGERAGGCHTALMVREMGTVKHL